MVQALPVLVGLIDQLVETCVDDPPDLPRQHRRKRHLQLDDLFETGLAAFDVALAERRREPVGIVGEQIRKALKVGDRPHQLRADRDIAVVQPVDLVDKDNNADTALIKLASNLGTHAQ